MKNLSLSLIETLYALPEIIPIKSDTLQSKKQLMSVDALSVIFGSGHGFYGSFKKAFT